MNAVFNEAPGATAVAVMAILWVSLLVIAPVIALF